MAAESRPTKEEIQDARIAALEQYVADMDADHSAQLRKLRNRLPSEPGARTESPAP